MCTWTIAFFIGTFLIRLITHQFDNYVVGTLFMGALGLLLIAVRLNFGLLRFIAGVGLGFSWVLFYTHSLLAWELPKQFEAIDVAVSGVIHTVPETNQLRKRFLFKVDHFRGKPIKPIKVSLSWYGYSPKLGVGDRWQLQVRLKRPHGFANPESFDYEAWVLQQGIRASGYVRKSDLNQLLKSDFLSYPIDRVRQKIVERLTEVSSNEKNLAITLALTLGLRSQLTAEQWRVFQKTGTSHLIAISGLHISLVSGLFYGLVSFFWRRFPRFCLAMPAQQVAAIGAIVAAIVYAALAGFAIPAQRALIMIVVIMACQILRTQTTFWQRLCLALLFVLIIDPLAILSASFYLSFAAVGLIFYGLSGRGLSPRGWLYKMLRTQWVVSIGLMPIGILFFHQVSLIAFLANLMAIPIIGLVCVPISLLGSLCLLLNYALAQGIFSLIDPLLTWTLQCLHWMSTFPNALWFKVFPSTQVFVASFVAILLLLAPKGWPSRWLGLLWGLPLFYSPLSVPALGDAWFSVLDVGQGLAAVLRTTNHVLVFDTGAKFSAQLNAGDAVLVPFLRTLGVRQIDVVVISHPHNDHKGGLNALNEAFPIKRFYTTIPEHFPKSQALPCAQGSKWEWDGVTFHFLYPPREGRERLDDNVSCVLKISVGDHGILIPGDIESDAEQALVATQQGQLNAAILVAPHHGSKTSSTVSFIDEVNPKYVLFSAGYLNQYHHPHPDIIKRYDKFNAKWYDTASSGSITFDILADSDLNPPKEYRLTQQRYWTKGS